MMNLLLQRYIQRYLNETGFLTSVEFFFIYLFLPKRCSLKIVVPRFKNIKRQFIILAESLKNTSEGVFFSNVASLVAET